MHLTITSRVDELYSQAANRYSTYEVPLIKAFSQAMREAFGDNEQIDERAVFAFGYARKSYDYQSEEEEQRLDAHLKFDDCCKHGLTFWTCPRGCFEID